MATYKYTATGGDDARKSIPWNVRKVEIDSNVLKIPPNEFNKLQFLEELDCSQASQLQEIGDYAIGSCAKLKTLDLRKAIVLERLGEGCFQYCMALAQVWLAPKLKSLPPRTFGHCSQLTNVHLNDELQEIQTQAFEFCHSLQTIKFGRSLKTIASLAFYMNESLAILELPDSLCMIKRQAFQHCRGLQKVIFGSELVLLSNQAFAECTSLDCVDMSAPKRLRVIHQECFVKALSLRKICFPESLKAIRDGAFSRCATLMKVDFPPMLEIVNDRAFERCTSLVRVEFPSSTKSIGCRAFNLCTNLKTVIFPQGLVSIGREAFAFCKLLETAELPAGTINDIGLNVFYGCPLLENAPDLWVYNGVDPIPSFVEHVVVSKNVKVIPSEPFYASTLCTEINLTTIQFNDDLEEIEAGAFSYCNCPGLTSVSIPSSVVRFADPFDETIVTNIDMRITSSNFNLALAIRLKLLYPNSTPSLTMSRLLYLYSFNHSSNNDDYYYLLPLPTGWSSVRSRLNRKQKGSYAREDELLQSQFAKERDLLREIQLAYPQAIHRLLLWCLERGMLNNTVRDCDAGG